MHTSSAVLYTEPARIRNAAVPLANERPSSLLTIENAGAQLYARIQCGLTAKMVFTGPGEVALSRAINIVENASGPG